MGNGVHKYLGFHCLVVIYFKCRNNITALLIAHNHPLCPDLKPTFNAGRKSQVVKHRHARIKRHHRHSQHLAIAVKEHQLHHTLIPVTSTYLVWIDNIDHIEACCLTHSDSHHAKLTTYDDNCVRWQYRAEHNDCCQNCDRQH